MGKSKDTEQFMLKDYLGATVIVLVFFIIIFVAVWIKSTYFEGSKPDCGDYAKYGMDGSDYCTEDQFNRP